MYWTNPQKVLRELSVPVVAMCVSDESNHVLGLGCVVVPCWYERCIAGRKKISVALLVEVEELSAI